MNTKGNDTMDVARMTDAELRATCNSPRTTPDARRAAAIELDRRVAKTRDVVVQAIMDAVRRGVIDADTAALTLHAINHPVADR